MTARLLLIDDNDDARRALAGALDRARHDVAEAATAKTATAVSDADLILHADLPDLPFPILMPTAPPETPVLVLDPAPSADRRLSALRFGARDAIPADTGTPLLLAHIRRLLREADSRRELLRRRAATFGFGMEDAAATFAHRPRAVVVDTGSRRGALSQLGTRHINADAALAPTAGRPPAVYILDATGPNRQAALDLLPELRTRAHSRHAATLVIHDPEDEGTAVTALNFGAGDLMPSDGSAAELTLRVRALADLAADRDALRRSEETSVRLATTDPLTGLYNRRYADAYLDHAIRDTGAEDGALAVFILDVDHFKRINDSHGHATGDAVLCEIAHRLKDNIRGSDLVARVGGEEFLIVLPDTGPSDVGAAAARLCALIADAPIHVAERALRVTVSIGGTLGRAGTPGLNSGTLLDAADAALYQAKTAGRNRATVAPAA